jgi:hypothetical protein
MDEINMNELSGPPNYGSSFAWRKPIIRKTLVYLVALFIIVGTLSLILASPLLLRQLARIRGIDWTGLSNVGQTYGAASAILSAVALIGITVSLLIQARQAKTERVRITRERHTELLRLILDAPEVYGPVIGVQARPMIGFQRYLFSTMWMNYARIGFQMGIITEASLRGDILGPAFESGPMREWWIGARRHWSVLEDRKERRLAQIIDEEYSKAVMAGPPKVLNIGDAPPDALATAGGKRYDTLAATVLGVAIGVILGSRLRANRR